MAFISRPAALALLSCCLVFGVLLGLTGLAKDSRPTQAAAEKAALRGFSEHEVVRRTLSTGGGPSITQDAAEVKQESLESVLWPELEGETGGLWGPDDEERLLLQLDGSKDVAADGEADLWGEELEEREHLAQVLLNGNWDRLMEIDDEDQSFSFSYTM